MIRHPLATSTRAKGLTVTERLARILSRTMITIPFAIRALPFAIARHLNRCSRRCLHPDRPEFRWKLPFGLSLRSRQGPARGGAAWGDTRKSLIAWAMSVVGWFRDPDRNDLDGQSDPDRKICYSHIGSDRDIRHPMPPRCPGDINIRNNAVSVPSPGQDTKRPAPLPEPAVCKS